MMFLPSVFSENLFDDWFNFPRTRQLNRGLYGKDAAPTMRTDVTEHEDRFELAVDLPGFNKDDINLTLENGYLSISATREDSNEEKDDEGKLIRRERFCGTMQRSFYVGDVLTEEDISAKFENGVLDLTVPKKEKRLPEKKTILIEG